MRSYLFLAFVIAATAVVSSAGKVTKEEAEKACAKVAASDRKACIFDVMATGDLEMAEAY